MRKLFFLYKHKISFYTTTVHKGVRPCGKFCKYPTSQCVTSLLNYSVKRELSEVLALALATFFNSFNSLKLTKLLLVFPVSYRKNVLMKFHLRYADYSICP